MAKNDFGAKTAEQMNLERRAAKARQQANAKAKAVSKEDNKVFNMVDTLKQKRIGEKKKAFAIRRGIENGDYLLKLAIEQNVLVMDRPPNADTHNYNGDGSEYAETGKWKHYINEEDVQEWQAAWVRGCYDVIAAAKRHPSRFEWNRDWKETGRLMLALPKEQKKAA